MNPNPKSEIRNPKSTDPLRRLFPYLAPLRLKIALGAVCTVVVSLLALNNANLLRGLLDAIRDGSVAELDHYALLVLLFFVTKGAFTFGQTYFTANVANRLAAGLRNQVYEHLQKLSLSFFESERTGNLMAAITTQVPALQASFTSGVVDALTAPVIIVGGTAWLFWKNWQLATISLVVVPFLALAIVRAGRRMKRHSRAAQGSLADVSAIAEETLAGIRVVQSFVMERHEVARFQEESRRAFRSLMRGARVRATLGPALEAAGAFGIVAVFWIGGRQAIAGKLTVGELGGFVFVLNLMADAFRNLGNIHLQLQQGRAAAERIFDLLDVPPAIVNRPDAPDLPRLEGGVTFDRVTFGYLRELPVLQEISFELKPGEIAALVGPSGSGKSTLASLIPRFYDVTAGAVRVDGVDVRDVTMESLRRQVGIVPQETLLFSGTVRENIAYGRLDASQEEVEAAARAANAHGFIAALPEGYDSVVGERGVKLSGGQRQRIAIARALLKDPRILILDEATSSLDARSEALVQEALEALMAGRTTIVIAHRLSTIRKADQIFVLEGGRIVERGAHDELLRSGGAFAGLYRTQFGL